MPDLDLTNIDSSALQESVDFLGNYADELIGPGSPGVGGMMAQSEDLKGRRMKELETSQLGQGKPAFNTF